MAKGVQDQEVDLIRTVGVCRVPGRLNFRGVVEQQVKHKVTFVLVCTNDARIDRHVVGHQRACTDALVQAEVFGRMPGVERVTDLRIAIPPIGKCRQILGAK